MQRARRSRLETQVNEPDPNILNLMVRAMENEQENPLPSNAWQRHAEAAYRALLEAGYEVRKAATTRPSGRRRAALVFRTG
jgi:hypothetical protein